MGIFVSYKSKNSEQIGTINYMTVNS